MNEQEWLACNDPQKMLAFIRTNAGDESFGVAYPSTLLPTPLVVSNRKLRLFVYAILDNCPNWKNDPIWRVGSTSPARPELVLQELDLWIEKEIEPKESWRSGYDGSRLQSPSEMASRIAGWRSREEPSQAMRAGFLRDLVGNPWRPMNKDIPCEGCGGSTTQWGLHRRFCSACDGTTDLPIIKCLTPTVLGIAKRTYDERDFGALPVLADALFDAGCDSEDLLRHLCGQERCPGCRDGWAGIDTAEQPGDMPWFHQACGGTGWIPLRGPHVRGCWALDLILGEE